MQVRDGFTIIEITVAVVLLAVVLVGMQATTARLVHVVTTSDQHALAVQIAEDRVELIRTDPNYDVLSDRYAETKTALDDPPGFTRTTLFLTVRDSSSTGIAEYKKITVTVDGPGLTEPVQRTVSVGKP